MPLPPPPPPCPPCAAHSQDAFMDESISTCRFAQRVASIKQDAKINEETDPKLLIRKLKQEIAELKEELAFYKKGEQNEDRVLSIDEVTTCAERLCHAPRKGLCDRLAPGAISSGLAPPPPQAYASFFFSRKGPGPRKGATTRRNVTRGGGGG